MKKKASIISSIIFPEDISITGKENLLLQLNMLLSSLNCSQEIIDIVLVTNQKYLIKKLAKINNIKERNFQIIYIDNKKLKCCNNEKGELFQYAFSKIDMLESIKEYLLNKQNIKSIIISDIDCLFLDIKKLINYSLSIRSIAAINYRSEQFTDYRFDKIIGKCMDNLRINPGIYNIEIRHKNLAWINSGFIILSRNLAINLPKYSDISYFWISKNKQKVKDCCSNHYSDELIFSTIFNYKNGVEIDNKKSKIARFIWTCKTKKLTQNFFNPIYPPAHLHLPSIKWENRQLKIISNLITNKLFSKLALILINLWSLENRINPNLKNLICFKVIFKTFRIIENFIIKFNKEKFDLINKNIINSIRT